MIDLYFSKIEKIITRIFYYTTIEKLKFNKNFISIIAYHEICKLPKEILHVHPYNVLPSAFEEQMEFLYKNNYIVIKLEDVISSMIEKKTLPHKPVVITFDDGYKNNYTNALPILKKYNFPATIFLATDYIGSENIFPWLNRLCSCNLDMRECWMPLTWEEVMKMSQDNLTFGSHTCSHLNIRLINENEFEEEIKKSKKKIHEKINKKVRLFSYPFSFPKYQKTYQAKVETTKKILQKTGFLGACTTIIGTNSGESDPFCLKRIQIKNTDNLFQFKAKIKGSYNWAGIVQKVYQRFLEPRA